MEYNNIPTIKLKLISSRDEVGNVRTFLFEKDGLTWIAGQSQAYILRNAGEKDSSNQRYFTITSAPAEGVIRISTRISESAFKRELNKLKPGDEIETFDLNGEFTWEEEPSEPVVMVAGGIGVTPFRSILVQRHKTGKHLPVTLLYFNRTNEVPFEKEFQELVEEHPEFKLQIIIGENITADRILELAPQAMKQVVYLSGPETMVDDIGYDLRVRGVDAKKDRFPGYDVTNY